MPVTASATTHASGRRGGPVTFVLSGGSARGAIQVGMLAALYAHGIAPRPDHRILGGRVQCGFHRIPPRNTGGHR